MTLRRRLALVCAAAAAVAVLTGSLIAYVMVGDSLRAEVDASLEEAAAVTAALPPIRDREGVGTVIARAPLEAPAVAMQVVGPNGDVLIGPPAGSSFDVGDGAAVATRQRGAFFEDREIQGVHARVYTAPGAAGTAVQVARPLTEVDAVLGRLRLGLALVVLLGVAGAALLARMASRRALQPVTELTAAAEHVAETQDLSRRIAAADGEDELARLAGAFNDMLEALQSSRASQRRLVADASHELRTPLTSLRTNLEVLGSDGGLDDRDRAKLRADLVVQLEEMSGLVGDLVDLARDEATAGGQPEDLRLDLLVAAAVERARRHSPGVRFCVDLVPTVVSCVPDRVDRAVANLLDNAAKFGGGDGPVEVAVRDGEVRVRDHGPGIAPDDLPRVFDRFYRSSTARSRPGSGLGLAIVRQVAEAHGGRVIARRPEGGGAELRLQLSSNS